MKPSPQQGLDLPNSSADPSGGPGKVAPSVSFEFFPNDQPAGREQLEQSIQKLAPLQPSFMSVTYGAGGSNQDKTTRLVSAMQQALTVPIAAHLTLINQPKAHIRNLLGEYAQQGVKHIVALRGDPQEGASFSAHKDGYQDTLELIQDIRATGGFEVSVAGYPEAHPEASSSRQDIDYLKRKVDAGASRILTQFFFEADVFLRFRDKAVAAGITVPIVPGILPVTHYERTTAFAKQCGASVPLWLHELFFGLDSAPEIRQLVAANLASELCLKLLEEGVDDFHLYTLNHWPVPIAICAMLGIKPLESSTSSKKEKVTAV